MCCTPSGYIIFSLRNLKFYDGRRSTTRYEGREPGAGLPKDPKEESKVKIKIKMQDKNSTKV